MSGSFNEALTLAQHLLAKKARKNSLTTAYESVYTMRAYRDCYCEKCGEVLPEGEIIVLHYDLQRERTSVWHRLCFAKRRF